jgi:hypothetical protein
MKLENLIALGFFLAFCSVVIEWRKAVRRKKLLKKYGDNEVVNRIMKKILWEGETEEMLLDSFGVPMAVDQSVYKSRFKETWKYNRTGKNQYRTRVSVEDGEVVGWNVRG